jgi:hypothetical protein
MPELSAVSAARGVRAEKMQCGREVLHVPEQVSEMSEFTVK